MSTETASRHCQGVDADSSEAAVREGLREAAQPGTLLAGMIGPIEDSHTTCLYRACQPAALRLTCTPQHFQAVTWYWQGVCWSATKPGSDTIPGPRLCLGAEVTTRSFLPLQTDADLTAVPLSVDRGFLTAYMCVQGSLRPALHYEILKYNPSTSKVHPKVLQNLIVLWGQQMHHCSRAT